MPATLLCLDSIGVAVLAARLPCESPDSFAPGCRLKTMRGLKRLTLLVLCLTASLEAQYPPDIQWRKIRTARYEVIFPREIEADAQRAGNMLETLNQACLDRL